MTTLTELAAMLDAATGPSHELNANINRVLGAHIDTAGTHSIDTALALVERLLPDSTGNQLSWRQRDVGKPGWCGYWASLVPAGEKTGGRVEAYAPTVPLAILKALVAALIAKEQQT